MHFIVIYHFKFTYISLKCINFSINIFYTNNGKNFKFDIHYIFYKYIRVGNIKSFNSPTIARIFTIVLNICNFW